MVRALRSYPLQLINTITSETLAPTKKHPSTSPTPNLMFRRSPYTFCKGSDTLHQLFRHVHQISGGVVQASDGVHDAIGYIIQPIPTCRRYLRIGKRPLRIFPERIQIIELRLRTYVKYLRIVI